MSKLDLAALRSALVHVRVAFDDFDFVLEDVMRPRTSRVWGYVTHAEKAEEAKAGVVQGLAFALDMLGPEPEEPPPDDGDDRGDPSGNGGAGPTH